LEEIATGVAKTGAPKPPVWLGHDGEIPLLAALLAQCRFYLGHDTGAMHLAAALGRPVIGIFGGGHWPRFRPVGRQVASVVQPLPCFGCNWDCHFGDALRQDPRAHRRAARRQPGHGSRAPGFRRGD
jgi:hypothetical protein